MEEIEDPELRAAHLKQQLPRNCPSILIPSDEEPEDKEPEEEPQTNKPKTKVNTGKPATPRESPELTARPGTIQLNYPDREYFGYSRVKRKPRDDGLIPPLAPHDFVMLHSSKGVRRDRYGREDPMGVNDRMEEEITNYFKSTPENTEESSPMYTGDDIPGLRAHWQAQVADLTGEIPLELPPWREVNHRIPLVDEEKRYTYHHPRCPDALKDELREKMDRYLKAGWWEMQPASQAAPLLCVCKKNGKLRTVVDARQRNDNTIKDVTPFPDQDNIRNDVARAKYRSKIDMSDAYEQIRIDAADIWKMAFSTIYGTAVSHVMQQGDCNAPSTFQRLMTWIFREYIGVFIHVYLDDIFVFSNSIEEHQQHLKLVFNCLREQKLFLSKSKLDLYSSNMECLGHHIDDQGLHADSDKLSRIRDWRPMRSLNEVQRFLGLVQYLAHFLPDVSAFTSPLESICKNGQSFQWRPIHQACLDRIKALANKTPILKPIDPKSNEPIWVITDASVYGIGAMYGQGPDWRTCRPAGFMSKKFSSTQRSYRTYEQEALGVIEALMKWEDRLIGRKFYIATDHEALTKMRTAIRDTKNPRLIQWAEYIDHFDAEIIHVEGEQNKVADYLSRYYENDTAEEAHPRAMYVNADIRLNHELDELPELRRLEVEADIALRAMELRRMRKPSEKVRDPNNMVDMYGRLKPDTVLPAEKPELRIVEAEELRVHAPLAAANDTDYLGPPSRSAQAQSSPQNEEMTTLQDALQGGPHLDTVLDSDPEFMTAVKCGYAEDTLFRKIIANPNAYPNFTLHDGRLYVRTRLGFECLCIPRVLKGDRRLTEMILDMGHSTLGHLGPHRTNEYLRRWVWWPRMTYEVHRFCATCGTCQTAKTVNRPTAAWLHSMPIPQFPWQSSGMDFVGPFPDVNGFNYVWVIICRLTSMLHLIACRVTDTAADLATVYIREVVRLHGVPESIVSDRDSKFTSRFWREVHRLLGTKLLMSTAFHPQTDGASERAIRNVGQILRSVVEPDQRNWLEKLPMVEFAINSSVSASTGFAPFELNYGYMPKMSSFPSIPGSFPGATAFAERARHNLEQAHDALIEAHVNSTHQANKRRDGDVPIFRVGDLVYLSTANLSLPKGRARKLAPKYIGPYAVLEAHPETSTYKLDIPPDLKRRRIHATFNVSLLKPHEPNDEYLFPAREASRFYDFGEPSNPEWLVDKITGHRWTYGSLEYLVHWTSGEHTWEPASTCRELQARGEYLRLLDVASEGELPQRIRDDSGGGSAPSSVLPHRPRRPRS